MKLKPYRFSFVANSVRHYWIRFYRDMEGALADSKQLALREYPDAHSFMIESNQSETSEIPEYWRK